ncbi:hypothetical protein [Dokdonella soli]|uniref:hypothetical protein n=1 Tax=Dokdonella soli TaxID=529810 RepID=UPI0031D49648
MHAAIPGGHVADVFERGNVWHAHRRTTAAGKIRAVPVGIAHAIATGGWRTLLIFDV